MFCSKCGNIIPDDARFCDKCGTPTIRNEKKSVDAIIEPVVSNISTEKTQAKSNIYTKNNEGTKKRTNASKPHNKKKKILIIVIVVVVIVALVFIVQNLNQSKQYQKAIDDYNTGTIESLGVAQKEFEQLAKSFYSNSADWEKESQYLLAIKYSEIKDFEKSLPLFQNISGYKNSDEYLEYTQSTLYGIANLAISRYSISATDVDNAKRIFKILGDYGNSQDKLRSIENATFVKDITPITTENIALIKNGMSKQDVISILGQPTADMGAALCYQAGSDGIFVSSYDLGIVVINFYNGTVINVTAKGNITSGDTIVSLGE